MSDKNKMTIKMLKMPFGAVDLERIQKLLDEFNNYHQPIIIPRPMYCCDIDRVISNAPEGIREKIFALLRISDDLHAKKIAQLCKVMDSQCDHEECQ